MPWQQRIKQAAYTAPDGTRQEFSFEDVRKTVDKKTSAFEFPDANGTYIQDLGVSGRRYPMKIFFHGDDHDLEANTFESLLTQKGIGRLETPIYGTIDVIPFGTITRSNGLVNDGNQSIIELTFFETIDLIYPSSQINPQGVVESALDDFNDSVTGQFESEISLSSAVERVKFKGQYQSLLDSASNNLASIAATKESIESEFNAIVDSINQGINILIGEPLTLAFQTVQLIQAPSRAADDIDARLNAYGDLANAIVSGEGAVVEPGIDSTNSNNFQTSDLYVSSYVSAMASSVVNNQFNTRSEAIEAAETILNQFESVAAWRESNYESLSQIDTGESYQQLQRLVSLTAGYLVEISFNLKQEKTIILDRDRSVIDLVFQLYGSIDDQLDFFINSNNLSGSEILELPRGKAIVYYI
jgi:prophage DNA circulation protein